MKTQSKYDPPRKTWAQLLLLRVWEESAFNITSRLMSQLNIPANIPFVCTIFLGYLAQ